MEESVVLHCINCGYEWAQGIPGGSRARTYACPVCEFPVSLQVASVAGAPLTIDELEQRLSALMAEARDAGVEDETIMQLLSDELEFAAELAHAGRNMCVQVIDLGPIEELAFDRPVRDRSLVLRRRALG
jgi:hypothetical protein